MSNIAAVKFWESEKPYHFACDIEGLERGERVVVETKDSDREAYFIGYTDEEMVGFKPKKSVVGRYAELNKNHGVQGGIRSRRTKDVIAYESTELRKFLQDNHPQMVCTNDIAFAMGWTKDQTSNFVKQAMVLEDKIIQVYRGWYTSKL